MRLVTVIIVVVALVISGVTAFLILRFLQSQSAQPVAEHELVPAERVLVAKVDLGSGHCWTRKSTLPGRHGPAMGSDSIT